ncbi:unnamed protein product [Bursaphelenchus okinawaensis]|uniref:Peptidase A1 domain-containing protein n=1 Tax=Bursaphelenchus okinawaensis TaxID=465554 RepID=A0A811KY42_9BILA|nr:unnamed protein product [Bursaphelenchus okinawaensis]CAG9114403.1 unnamed protein product [Bursaphelenchus okinawaensis]
MKFVALLTLVVGFVNSLEFDQEKSSLALSIGDKDKVDLKFTLALLKDFVVVFGAECKEAGSCSKNGHPFYNAEKDGITLENGEDVLGFKTKLAKEVKVNSGGKTSKLDVNVIVDVTHQEMKKQDFKDDAVLGLKTGKDTPFDKLVSPYESNNQYLIMVPKFKDDDKSVPEGFLGTEPKNACNKFNLVESTSDIWTNDFNKVINDKEVTFKIAPAFEETYAASTKGLELIGDLSLTKDAYNKLKTFNITYGGVEIEFDPQAVYKFDNNMGTYKRTIATIDNEGFDLVLPNSLLKNHCIKLVKDGDKYNVGLAERQNGVGLAAASLVALIGMFALLQF